MSIIRPQISKELITIDDFSSYAQNFFLEELPVL